MEFHNQRRFTLAAAIVLIAGLLGAKQVFADIVPPKQFATTPGGINVADGSLQYSVTDLAVGTMKLERSHRTGLPNAQSADPVFGGHFDSNFNIYVSVTNKTSGNPRNLVVHLGNRASGIYGRYVPNTFVGPANKDAERAVLSFDGTRYTYIDVVEGGGTTYTFHPTIQAKGVLWASESRVVERIDFPDGRRQTFSYDGNGNLKLVEDSAGYAMVFDYNANNDVTAACAFNRSQTYVNASSTCAGAAMKTTYSYSGGTLLSSTDVMGQVTNYTISSRGMTCLKPPGFSTCTMSVVYSGNRASSQTLLDGGTWGTSGMTPEVLNDPEAGWLGYNETTMVDPNGVTSWMNFQGSSPLALSDALGHTTSFTFRGSGVYPDTETSAGSFLMQAIYAEGNKYVAEYNGPFWAITKETMVAKPGSGLADLVKTYGYGSGSCTTYQNCKPTWIRDPKNNQTDFTYASHGGLLTEMKPAPTAGASRPLTIKTYVQKYAYIKNSGDSLVPAATPIWMLSTWTQCQTVAGSSATVCDSSGPQIVSTYQYGNDGTANNLLVKGVAVAADGQTRRTCTGYDVWARKVSETKPNAGQAVCP